MRTNEKLDSMNESSEGKCENYVATNTLAGKGKGWNAYHSEASAAILSHVAKTIN